MRRQRRLGVLAHLARRVSALCPGPKVPEPYDVAAAIASAQEKAEMEKGGGPSASARAKSKDGPFVGDEVQPPAGFDNKATAVALGLGQCAAEV